MEKVKPMMSPNKVSAAPRTNVRSLRLSSVRFFRKPWIEAPVQAEIQNKSKQMPRTGKGWSRRRNMERTTATERACRSTKANTHPSQKTRRMGHPAPRQHTAHGGGACAVRNSRRVHGRASAHRQEANA